MVASILLGYHQYQMAAETALAKKVLVPDRVFVQNFYQNTDGNAFGKIHVLAEAAFDRSVRTSVGNDGAVQSFDVVPIYPVSRQAFSEVKSLGAPPRRPASRSDAKAISARYDAMARIETIPVGMLVFKATATSETPDLSSRYLGQGRNGPLIDLLGQRIEGADFLNAAAGPLAEQGLKLIEGALVISPYVQGTGADAVSVDYTSIQRSLFWTSLLMLVIGLSIISVTPPSVRRKGNHGISQVKAVGAFPAIDPFQPIVGQDEIGGKEEEPEEQKVSRVKTFASHVFRTKNRQ